MSNLAMATVIRLFLPQLLVIYVQPYQKIKFFRDFLNSFWMMFLYPEHFKKYNRLIDKNQNHIMFGGVMNN